MSGTAQERLKPCPFCCGEGKYISYRVAEDAMGCHVECTSCFAKTDVYEDAYAPHADAIAAWNRRPFGAADLLAQAEARERELVEALKHIAKTWPDSFAARTARATLSREAKP